MARKPAHLELSGGKGPRQRVWEAMRRQPENFTANTVVRASSIDKPTVQTYLQALQRGGFIEQIGERKAIGDQKHYRLVRDTGVEAPRLDRQGRPVMQSRGNENMWRTMRIMGEFSPRELALRASTPDVVVTDSTAQSYVKCLAHAGYLTVIDPGHAYIRGKGAKQARYRLPASKYTGPRPPMVQRTKAIYDPNLGKIMWQEEPDHDAC
ncbi:helix-turn-helix domain-containing protein [Burkholderia pyrrocinia]|uniref:helix-turn-helix domain-containing protein n=1 Tax=Burkholderia pyrrocinia TaxID=60550 RepID=UPI0015882B47|nr:helix-turn-helix domain-containing protein [Burkholderia pyrrocinia]